MANANRLTDTQVEWATLPLVNVCIIFMIIDTFFVLAKTYSRHRLARLPFWWDDFWILPAYVLIVATAALGMAMSKVEVNMWKNDLTTDENLDKLQETMLKLIFAFLQLLLPSFPATRFSILALYLRLFSGKLVRRITWAVIGFVTLQYFVFAIVGVFMCTPVAFFWDRTIEGGSCFDINSFFRAVTMPNIVVDLIVIFLPIPSVWQLKASNFRKWALTMVFAVGTLALAASIIRLWVYESHTMNIAPWDVNIMILWLVVEPSIYLIASCLPGMHHILAKMVPKAIDDWIEQRLAALTHPLSSTPNNATNASQSGVSGQAFLHSDFSRLADDPRDGFDGTKSSVHAGRRDLDRETYEMEQQQGVGMKGIVVTSEVTITQEERIAQIIGF